MDVTFESSNQKFVDVIGRSCHFRIENFNVIYRITGLRQGLLVGFGDIRVEVPLGDGGSVHQLRILLVVFNLIKTIINYIRYE